MEADAVSRYRSRILREMNANRENPFNSPPSSTGSHGTVSPTLSSVFSDPDGESTRRLNEDIARVTAPRNNPPINWEAAHRKWPEFFGMPKSRNAPIFDDQTDTRPLSAESKENKPPAAAVKFAADDSTQNIWTGSNRTRAEMQPSADTESDLSSILARSPVRTLSNAALKITRNPSPLAKVQTRVPSDTMKEQQHQRQESLSDALERLRNVSQTPKSYEQQEPAPDRPSPQMSSAKSSLTAVPPSPESMHSPSHNETNARSFFMPDVSHLGDFVTGTLRFSGSMRNGVPIFVKNGKVHDLKDKYSANHHAEVDGLEVPEDEEKIFVSMDMIREEIISLQEHYDKVQEYAENLQQQVEQLEAQLKSRKHIHDEFSSHQNEQLMIQKHRLEVEVSTLQSRLEQVSRKTSLNEIENDAVSQERDRAVRKLQEACEDINKLTRKLSTKEKELETTHRQLESTEQIRQDNDTFRRDLMSLKHGRDALELENTSLEAANKTLRQENESLKLEIESLRSGSNKTRQDQEALITENRSLRSNNKTLIEENEDLRENLDGAQHELDAAREEVETLQQEVQNHGQEKISLREDNESLVRHNEKYFSENKILRRENSGFERSIHDMHDENVKLKDEVEFLKQQLDHCRPIPKEDFSAQLDEETEENMTSAFFIPDITINTNDTNPVENTETKDLPELTAQSTKLPTIPDVTEQETRNTTKRETTSHTETREIQHKSRSKSKSSSAKTGQSQKVAFSIPEKSSSKTSSNVANQGSKRRKDSQTSRRASSKGATVEEVDQFDENDDTTGLQSVDNTTQTQDYSIQLNVVPKARKEFKTKEQKQATQDLTSQSQKSQHVRSQSRSSQRHTVVSEFTADSIRSVDKDTCATLSIDARRVLDDLCEHNCRNCTVCSRITSHRGILTSADLAVGKKRVTVSRPVPVTDRDISTEDHTMRPANSPGHALAMVIKGLEDESHHLQLELSRIQAQYNGRDKALGRRERISLAENIRALLKRLEAKNDQIYSLYDVLEGQKAAGQAMSEEEIEMTVLNITGMTVRDVTRGSDQLTWEGIPEL